MRKLFFIVCTAATLLVNSGCDKDKDDQGGGSCNLPSTPAPAGVAGGWVRGQASSTVVRDAYNGKYVGTGFKTGEYLKFDADGKNAELVVLVDGGYYSGLQSVTKMNGTVVFDEDEQTLEFKVCSAWYKGWRTGTKTVDRAATDDEVRALTQNNRFYYVFDPSSNYPLTLWFQSLPVDDNHANSFRRD